MTDIEAHIAKIPQKRTVFEAVVAIVLAKVAVDAAVHHLLHVVEERALERVRLRPRGARPARVGVVDGRGPPAAGA